MSLLKKIIDRDEKIVAAPTVIESARTEAVQFEAPQPPRPCPDCRSPIVWFDRYGGGPHCAVCHPPPSRALEARRCSIVVLDDGTFALHSHGASGVVPAAGESPPSVAGEPIDLDAEFGQRWREYLTGTVKNPRRVIQRRDFKFTEPMSK